MFVNGTAFLVSLSRGIRFYTAEHVPNRKAKQLAHSLRRIVNLYARGGYRVRTIMMDMEFEKVKDEKGMELIDVDTTAACEHVGEIEEVLDTSKNAAAVASVRLLSRESNFLRRRLSSSLCTM